MAASAPRLVKRTGDALIALGGLALLIGLGERAQRSMAALRPGIISSHPAINYSPRICEDAWGHDKDYSGDQHLTHFSVVLREGCFSHWITFPKWWTTWHTQFSRQDGWVAFWFSGIQPDGPFYSSDKWSLNNRPSSFRVQGLGTLTIYTNVRQGPGGEDRSYISGEKKEIQERNNDVVAKPGQPPHETASPPGTAKQFKDFLFTIGDCRLSADYLMCIVNITNRGEERDLSIGTRSTRVIDSGGHEHQAVKLTLGAKECGRGDWLQNRLAPDVTLMATMGFEQVPPDSTSIPLLEFGENWGEVKFYGVPVIK